MNVSAVGFFVCAALLVASCLITVVLRPPRLTLLASAAVVVSLAVLLVVSGAKLLALLVLLSGLIAVGLLTLAGRRGGFGDGVEVVAWGHWPLATAVALVLLAVIDITALVSDTGYHRGNESADLITILHLRTPIAVGALAVLALTTLLVAAVIGRTSPDEVAARRAREVRSEREERMRRRRQDRAAARQNRDASGRGR